MPEKTPKKRNLLKHDEIAVFCTQLSLILKAGIPLIEGIPLLKEEVGNSSIQKALKIMEEYIERGDPLYLALEASGKFPSYLVNMCRIGEVSGKLDEVMDSMAAFYEREKALKRRIRSAVTYPLVLLIMMAAVITLLIVQVLPMFDDILRSMDAELPAFARGLMSAGLFIGQYAAFIIIALIAVIILLVFFSRADAGKRFFDNLFAKLPGLRKMTNKIAAGRFASAMAFLLSSGVESGEALDMASTIIDNRYISDKVKTCRAMLDSGASMPDALQATKIFPRLFIRMLNVGFKTGGVDDVMQKLSVIYETEIDVSLKRMTSLIEPILVAVLSVVVGVILLSVLLPMVSIMSSIA